MSTHPDPSSSDLDRTDQLPVLDVAASHPPAEKGEPFPEADLRSAADEFFQTLRVMLELNHMPAREGVSRQEQEGE